MRNMYLILRAHEGDAHARCRCVRTIYYRHRCCPPTSPAIIMACNSVITARAVLDYGVT